MLRYVLKDPVFWCVVIWFAFLGTLLFAMGAVEGAEFKKPHPTPEALCQRVRVGVATFGVDTVLKWAREQGYTSTQIMQARKCLKGE